MKSSIRNAKEVAYQATFSAAELETIIGLCCYDRKLLQLVEAARNACLDVAVYVKGRTEV